MTVRRAVKKKRIAVGSKVRFKLGGRDVLAVVVEDRGLLGVGGEQVWRVQVRVSGIDEVMDFELPASDLRIAS
jgi:hypothetical protein